MKRNYASPRSISRSGWVSKPVVILLFIFFTITAQANFRVDVKEFELTGSGDIAISPAEMTRLLWRSLEDDERFEVLYGDSLGHPDSIDFLIEGKCLFEGNDYFDLTWSISRPANSYIEEFSYKGNGLKNTRKVLSASVDSMFSPIFLGTNPDSLPIIVDGSYLGQSPLTFNDFPLGRHSLRLEATDGTIFEDSFFLTRDSAAFYFTIPVIPRSETAYIRLLSPPKCDLYVNGAHIPTAYNQVYKLTPGEAQVHLVSPQYGTRNLNLSLVAGDTLVVGFFAAAP